VAWEAVVAQVWAAVAWEVVAVTEESVAQKKMMPLSETVTMLGQLMDQPMTMFSNLLEINLPLLELMLLHGAWQQRTDSPVSGLLAQEMALQNSTLKLK
jgi:hypothetical protein